MDGVLSLVEGDGISASQGRLYTYDPRRPGADKDATSSRGERKRKIEEKINKLRTLEDQELTQEARISIINQASPQSSHIPRGV